MGRGQTVWEGRSGKPVPGLTLGRAEREASHLGCQGQLEISVTEQRERPEAGRGMRAGQVFRSLGSHQDTGSHSMLCSRGVTHPGGPIRGCYRELGPGPGLCWGDEEGGGGPRLLGSRLNRPTNRLELTFWGGRQTLKTNYTINYVITSVTSVLKERGGCEGLLGGSALARGRGRLPQGHDADLRAE